MADQNSIPGENEEAADGAEGSDLDGGVPDAASAGAGGTGAEDDTLLELSLVDTLYSALQSAREWRPEWTEDNFGEITNNVHRITRPIVQRTRARSEELSDVFSAAADALDTIGSLPAGQIDAYMKRKLQEAGVPRLKAEIISSASAHFIAAELQKRVLPTVGSKLVGHAASHGTMGVVNAVIPHLALLNAAALGLRLCAFGVTEDKDKRARLLSNIEKQLADETITRELKILFDKEVGAAEMGYVDDFVYDSDLLQDEIARQERLVSYRKETHNDREFACRVLERSRYETLVVMRKGDLSQTDYDALFLLKRAMDADYEVLVGREGTDSQRAELVGLIVGDNQVYPEWLEGRRDVLAEHDKQRELEEGRVLEEGPQRGFSIGM